MRRTLILDFEKDRCRLLAASLVKGRVQVRRLAEREIGDGHHRTDELASLLDGEAAACADVFVLVSDRRIVHGYVDTPKRPKASDLPALLDAEARRQGMFAEDEALCLGYRVGKRPDGWRTAFVVVPAEVLDGLLETLRSLGLERVHVASIEAVLAVEFGRGDGDETVAILDVHADQARLILAQGGVVLGTRKIKLSLRGRGGGFDPAGFLPMGAEVQRSLSYFAEHGIPRPGTIRLCGEIQGYLEHRYALDEALGMKAVPVETPKVHGAWPEDVDPCGWSPHLVLAERGRRLPVPFLVEPPAVWPRVLRTAATQGGGAAALILGAVLWLQAGGFAGREVRRERVRVLHSHLAMLEAAHRIPPEVRVRRRIAAVLQRRRVPVSRVLATLANERPAGVRFSGLDWDDGVLKLEGRVRSASQLEAVAAFGDLDRVLAALPGVECSSCSVGKKRIRGRDVEFVYEVRFTGGR